jgi:hypothetical protein
MPSTLSNPYQLQVETEDPAGMSNPLNRTTESSIPLQIVVSMVSTHKTLWVTVGKLSIASKRQPYRGLGHD